MIEKYLNRTFFSSYNDMKKNLSLNIPENFNFAYDVLDKWAETDPDNIASQRVLEKAGFAPTGEQGEEGPRFLWQGNGK